MSEEMEMMEDMGCRCPYCYGILDMSQWTEGECYACGNEFEQGLTKKSWRDGKWILNN